MPLIGAQAYPDHAALIAGDGMFHFEQGFGAVLKHIKQQFPPNVALLARMMN